MNGGLRKWWLVGIVQQVVVDHLGELVAGRAWLERLGFEGILRLEGVAKLDGVVVSGVLLGTILHVVGQFLTAAAFLGHANLR